MADCGHYSFGGSICKTTSGFSIHNSIIAGRAVAVLVGSEMAAMADNAHVRCVDAATMRVGTGSADNA